MAKNRNVASNKYLDEELEAFTRKLYKFIHNPAVHPLFQRRYGTTTNFWRILEYGETARAGNGASSYETRYSRMLRWLMDPTEAHGLRFGFVDALLEEATKSEEATESTDVKQDHDKTEASRAKKCGVGTLRAQVVTEKEDIDVFYACETTRTLIAIENKMGSEVHESMVDGVAVSQLDKYYATIFGGSFIKNGEDTEYKPDIGVGWLRADEKAGKTSDFFDTAVYDRVVLILLAPELDKHLKDELSTPEWYQVTYSQLVACLNVAMQLTPSLDALKLIKDFRDDVRDYDEICRGGKLITEAKSVFGADGDEDESGSGGAIPDRVRALCASLATVISADEVTEIKEGDRKRYYDFYQQAKKIFGLQLGIVDDAVIFLNEILMSRTIEIKENKAVQDVIERISEKFVGRKLEPGEEVTLSSEMRDCVHWEKIKRSGKYGHALYWYRGKLVTSRKNYAYLVGDGYGNFPSSAMTPANGRKLDSTVLRGREEFVSDVEYEQQLNTVVQELTEGTETEMGKLGEWLREVYREIGSKDE